MSIAGARVARLTLLDANDERPSTVYNLPISTSTKTRSLPSVHQATDVRLGRIVRLLMGHATVVVSGTKIAEEIGTSRSEVWRLIQQLRGLGVDVAGHPATGYQLRAVPDLLLPEMFAPSLKGTIFGGARQIHHYYKIGSTNSEAMRLAAEGAPEGSVFLAEEQLAGRGRGGTFVAFGAIVGDLLLGDPAPGDAAFGCVDFFAGGGTGGARGGCGDCAALRVDLKWPNDVAAGRQEILRHPHGDERRGDARAPSGGWRRNQRESGRSFRPSLREIATSLRIETGTEWSRVELCAALLKSLDREYRSLVEDGEARDAILRRFEESSSSVRGEKVSIEENNGLAGVTEGLDEQGFLRVRTAQGLQTVLSGTVRIVSNL